MARFIKRPWLVSVVGVALGFICALGVLSTARGEEVAYCCLGQGCSGQGGDLACTEDGSQCWCQAAVNFNCAPCQSNPNLCCKMAP